MEPTKMDLSEIIEQERYTKRKQKLGLCLSLFGLILLAPLLLLIALSIKLENPRAQVLFKQKRVGKAGKEFWMYKFRTMQEDAEKQLQHYLLENEIEGAMFKMKNDPRITQVGRFLRKTSLDELPQLWNVVRGEMALVGPRPPLPREVAEYTSYEKLRLAVTPGCTGLWQVSGRNELSFQEMVELDLKYIRNSSFKLDVQILCRTVFVILIPKGAY